MREVAHGTGSSSLWTDWVAAGASLRIAKLRGALLRIEEEKQKEKQKLEEKTRRRQRIERERER